MSKIINDGLEGMCPHCKEAKEMNYGPFEITDEGGFFDVDCGNCNKIFREWYNINYACQTIPEED
jgi:hypothetical protein